MAELSPPAMTRASNRRWNLLCSAIADARAELALLRGRTDVDKRRVGLIGHSEGALIAPWIAARVLTSTVSR